MKLHCPFLLTLAAVLLLVNLASAQFPTAAPTGAAAAGSTAAGGAQQATTIWGKLGLSQANLAKHKAKFCKSGLGTLVKSMFSPIKTLTGGGLIGPCCSDVLSAEDLAKMTPENTSASQAAAAKIKAEEAQAKERIAAIEYLATVDCHYWPEAEAALITSLRTDRNECVRLAAAQAFAKGCCCTNKTVEALQITVSGSEKDGNPYEKSERVKEWAFIALHQCIAKMQGQPVQLTPPEPPIAEPPEKNVALNAKGAIRQVSMFNKKRRIDTGRQEVLKDALRAYASNVGAPARRPGTKRSPQSLLEMWKAARQTAPPELPTASPGQTPARVSEPTLRPIGEAPLMLPDFNGQQSGRVR